MKTTGHSITAVWAFTVPVWKEEGKGGGEGAGINEPVFEICSIISRGTISAAGCLDLHKYAHGSDNERRAEAAETSSVRFTDELSFVPMIESVYSLCGN